MSTYTSVNICFVISNSVLIKLVKKNTISLIGLGSINEAEEYR